MVLLSWYLIYVLKPEPKQNKNRKNSNYLQSSMLTILKTSKLLLYQGCCLLFNFISDTYLIFTGHVNILFVRMNWTLLPSSSCGHIVIYVQIDRNSWVNISLHMIFLVVMNIVTINLNIELEKSLPLVFHSLSGPTLPSVVVGWLKLSVGVKWLNH